jgi:hypothetical protein
MEEAIVMSIEALPPEILQYILGYLVPGMTSTLKAVNHYIAFHTQEALLLSYSAQYKFEKRNHENSSKKKKTNQEKNRAAINVDDRKKYDKLHHGVLKDIHKALQKKLLPTFRKKKLQFNWTAGKPEWSVRFEKHAAQMGDLYMLAYFKKNGVYKNKTFQYYDEDTAKAFALAFEKDKDLVDRFFYFSKPDSREKYLKFAISSRNKSVMSYLLAHRIKLDLEAAILPKQYHQLKFIFSHPTLINDVENKLVNWHLHLFGTRTLRTFKKPFEALIKQNNLDFDISMTLLTHAISKQMKIEADFPDERQLKLNSALKNIFNELQAAIPEFKNLILSYLEDLWQKEDDQSRNLFIRLINLINMHQIFEWIKQKLMVISALPDCSRRKQLPQLLNCLPFYETSFIGQMASSALDSGDYGLVLALISVLQSKFFLTELPTLASGDYGLVLASHLSIQSNFLSNDALTRVMGEAQGGFPFDIWILFQSWLTTSPEIFFTRWQEIPFGYPFIANFIFHLDNLNPNLFDTILLDVTHNINWLAHEGYSHLVSLIFLAIASKVSFKVSANLFTFILKDAYLSEQDRIVYGLWNTLYLDITIPELKWHIARAYLKDYLNFPEDYHLEQSIDEVRYLIRAFLTCLNDIQLLIGLINCRALMQYDDIKYLLTKAYYTCNDFIENTDHHASALSFFNQVQATQGIKRKHEDLCNPSPYPLPQVGEEIMEHPPPTETPSPTCGRG